MTTDRSSLNEIAAQRASVRALLQSRFKQGLLRYLSHELGVSDGTLSRFKREGRGFPNTKLEALRALLLKERDDPNGQARALLRTQIAQGQVRASQVARACGVNRSSVSRFLSGAQSFRAETLTQVMHFLEHQPEHPQRPAAAGKRSGRAREAIRRTSTTPAPLNAHPSPLHDSLRATFDRLTRALAAAALRAVQETTLRALEDAGER